MVGLVAFLHCSARSQVLFPLSINVVKLKEETYIRTGKMKKEKAKTKLEEQDMGKGEAPLPFDAAKLNGKKIAEVRFFDVDKMRLRNMMPIKGCRIRAHIPSLYEMVLVAKKNCSMEAETDGKVDEKKSEWRLTGNFGDMISHSMTAALNGIMEASTCCNVYTMGLCGKDSTEVADVLEKVSRRAKRESLFDVVVMASVTGKPDYRRIQDKIGEALGLKFDDDVKGLAKRRSVWWPIAWALGLKSDHDVVERATKLRERILKEQKILVILTHLCKGLDLDKVGIPFGADHRGCMLLLTSASVEVLSKEMRAQKIFKV